MRHHNTSLAFGSILLLVSAVAHAQEPCPDPDRGGLQCVIQTRSVNQVPERFAAVAPSPDGANQPGLVELAPYTATIAAGVVSDLPENPDRLPDGVQGWSISLQISGDVELEDATIEGTVAADLEDGGLFDGGFRGVEIARPDRNGGLRGVVAWAALSFMNPVALMPSGTATLLELHIGGDPGASGEVSWRDGLVGHGAPVENLFTVRGDTYRDICFQSARLEFSLPPPARFVRGEANADGRVDISDAITIFNFLFRGGPTPTCIIASDANGDGQVDLSDPITIFNFLFQATSSNPMRGPRRCEDEQPRIRPELCPPESTPCG